MNSVSRYFSRLISNNPLIVSLALEDFRDQYRNSYLGVVWSIVRPLVFVAAIWFVFSYGIKGGVVDQSDTPFILHLLCGYLPWLLFSDSVSGSMNAITSKKFLLRQATFQPSLLPAVKFCSALILHSVFLVILFLLLVSYGFVPSVFWLQIPAVLVMLFSLVLGLGWLTSALRVFSSDIAQVVAVVLQVGFWVTPVFWSLEVLPEKAQSDLALNPMVYVVEGYRSALLRQELIWEPLSPLILFSVTSFFTLIVGAIVFRKLRPHFGEVL